MKKEIICTVCPRGCHILVEGEGETVVSVSGYGCKNGLRYASAEFAHPMRVLTSSVRIAGRDDTLLPVRSAGPVPKAKRRQRRLSDATTPSSPISAARASISSRYSRLTAAAKGGVS